MVDIQQNSYEKLKSTSRFISLILRHKPEKIGISLDEHGWANVDELIAGIAATRPFNMEMLEEIVQKDDKQRYSFNGNKTMIRANQGHSIPVNVELERKLPSQISLKSDIPTGILISLINCLLKYQQRSEILSYMITHPNHLVQ